MRRAALIPFAAVALFLTGGPSAVAPAQPPDPKADAKKEDAFKGRTKAGKKQLLKDFGGSEEGEEAVMLGLAWLTQQQKQGGNWQYDRGHPGDHAAATGMAILAFTGAGQSHKEGRYKQTVQAGVDWLVKNVKTGNAKTAGQFNTITNMYSQGIATTALCEAYGLTQDPALKEAAQLAVDYIQTGQGRNGSWGYGWSAQGDTSIVGWQIQALHAAKLAGLRVDDAVIKKAVAFLEYVSTAPTPQSGKSVYGYNAPGQAAGPGTSLTAIGLLCRYYIDGWRNTDAGFAEGTKGLLKRAPSGSFTLNQLDLYYYYYATQVVRFHGGEEWRTWNEGALKPDGTRAGGMPNWLLKLQVRTPTERGSWDPEPSWIGSGCGRLGTTCLCLLTLEVYYRYAPEDGANAPKKP